VSKEQAIGNDEDRLEAIGGDWEGIVVPMIEYGNRREERKTVRGQE